MRLLRATEDRFLKEIDFDSLPKTFRNAISLTRFLNIQYIWIDSLCIVQDVGDPDWNREAPLMAEVYGNSFCNIAAANARDGTEGLFRSRSMNTVPPSTARTRWYGEEMDCYVIYYIQKATMALELIYKVVKVGKSGERCWSLN